MFWRETLHREWLFTFQTFFCYLLGLAIWINLESESRQVLNDHVPGYPWLHANGTEAYRIYSSVSQTCL